MGFVQRLKQSGTLSESQGVLLEAIGSRRLFSLHSELRTLLYLGALFFIAGVGATVKKHFADLGHIAVLSALTALVLGSFFYCFRRGKPYADELVEQPSAVFDYVLYLGCALLGVEFGYLEAHFALLGPWRDLYLLGGGALALWLSYRFDNRLVLALGLFNLGAWIGMDVSWRPWDFLGIRPKALAYGAAVIAGGFGMRSRGIKPHFLDTYLHVGLNILFWALLGGVAVLEVRLIYTVLLALLAGYVIRAALRARRFPFFAYGVVYGYVGLSIWAFDLLSGFVEISLYFIVSSSAVVALLFWSRRSLEADQ